MLNFQKKPERNNMEKKNNNLKLFSLLFMLEKRETKILSIKSVEQIVSLLSSQEKEEKT